MKNVKPYLMFPGNCEEAMTFYSECLGGEITMMRRYDDAPFDVPDELMQKVFNSEFRAGDVSVMASDTMPPYEVKTGSNFALFLVFSDPAEQENAFAKLSAGGKVTMPLEGGFGMLTDKYDIQWMLAFDAH